MGNQSDTDGMCLATYILVDHLIKLLEKQGVLTAGQVEDLYAAAAKTAAESSIGEQTFGHEAIVTASELLRAYIE